MNFTHHNGIYKRFGKKGNCPYMRERSVFFLTSPQMNSWFAPDSPPPSPAPNTRCPLRGCWEFWIRCLSRGNSFAPHSPPGLPSMTQLVNVYTGILEVEGSGRKKIFDFFPSVVVGREHDPSAVIVRVFLSGVIMPAPTEWLERDPELCSEGLPAVFSLCGFI